VRLPEQPPGQSVSVTAIRGDTVYSAQSRGAALEYACVLRLCGAALEARSYGMALECACAVPLFGAAFEAWPWGSLWEWPLQRSPYCAFTCAGTTPVYGRSSRAGRVALPRLKCSVAQSAPHEPHEGRSLMFISKPAAIQGMRRARTFAPAPDRFPYAGDYSSPV